MELHLYTNGILIMTMINRAELLLLFVTTIVQSFLRYNLFGHALHLSAKRVEDPNDYDCLKMSKIIVELKLEETLFLSRKISNLLRFHSQQNSSLIQSRINALQTLLSSARESLPREYTRGYYAKHGPEMDEKGAKSAATSVSPPATRSRFMYYRKQGSEYSPLSRCLCSKHRVFAVPSIK